MNPPPVSNGKPNRRQTAPAITAGDRPILITGGAGFIATNPAHRCLSDGRPMLLFDNLSRPGVERNIRWLCETHGDRVQIELGDIRDFQALRRAVAEASQVFHFGRSSGSNH